MSTLQLFSERMLEGAEEAVRTHIGDDDCFGLNLEGPSFEHDYLCTDDPMLTGSLPKNFDADSRLAAVIDDVANADVQQFVPVLDEVRFLKYFVE